MAICKDCIYYEVCPLGLEIKGETGTCLKFKDKSRFVEVPCNVGDKVAVRALCECVYTLPIFEECRNECPFEDDCPFEECDNANEMIFVTKVNRIFNDGYGWKFEFNHLGVEASINDMGTSFFVGENAEQQAKEYEAKLKERKENER